MIGLVGLDHYGAPAETRGRLIVTGERLTAVLRALAAAPAVEEVALLSTCHRTEVYLSATDWPAARASVERFLMAAHRLGPEAGDTVPPADSSQLSGSVIDIPACDGNLPQDIAPYLYTEEASGAARHLLRAAAGLRVMDMGDAHMLDQVKEALTAAESVGCVGEELRALFAEAIRVGTRIRAETRLGQRDPALAHAAVQVASDALGGLTGIAALVIGAGRTSQLCAHLLRAEGVGRLVLATRTVGAAADLAAAVDGEAVALEDVCEVLADIDLILSATAAPHVVLSAATIACGLRGRRRPLVIVDLASSADVEPAAGLLPQVTLYTLDQLRPAGGMPVVSGDGGTDAEPAPDVDLDLAAIGQAEALVAAGMRAWTQRADA